MTVDVNFGDLTGDSDAGSNQGTPGQPLHHFHSISPSTTSFVRSPFGSLQEKFEVSLFTPPLGITRSCHHTLTHRPSGRKLAVPDPADPDSENRHDPKAFLRDP
nr:uncharacterized protein LOC117852609 isoform X5 [Setaria viridis]